MAKEKSGSGKRAAITLIVILFILILLALPWVYLQFASFPWDDYKTLAAKNAEPFDYVDFTPQAEVTVRLTKADLYSLLLRYCPPEQLLRDAGLSGMVKLELEELGFSIQPTEARLSLRLGALGFLHLPAQLRAKVEASGNGLLLTPEAVYIGPLLHISAEKLAQRLGQPDLARPYPLDPGDYGFDGAVLRAEEDGVLLTLPLPAMLPDLLDLSVAGYADLLDFYGVEEYPAAVAAARGEGFASAFRAAIRAGKPKELLSAYLAVGEEGVTDLLADYAGDIPEGCLPDPDQVLAEREAAMALLAGGQRKYESLLENLRETYKSGALTLVPGGFQLEDRALTLADLGWTGAEPGPWRAVYLYSNRSAHPAATADMPRANELPYTDLSALPETASRLVDLALILPFPNGRTVLMYRTADGELVLNALRQEMAAELLAAELTPTVCTDNLPTSGRWSFLNEAPAEDLMPVYYLDPDE